MGEEHTCARGRGKIFYTGGGVNCISARFAHMFIYFDTEYIAEVFKHAQSYSRAISLFFLVFFWFFCHIFDFLFSDVCEPRRFKSQGVVSEWFHLFIDLFLFSFWNSICVTNKYDREICLETYRITVNWGPPVRIQNSYRCASSISDAYRCIHWSRTLAYITQSKYVLKSTDCMNRHEVKRDMHAHVHKYNAHKHIISELETPEAFVCRLFILA